MKPWWQKGWVFDAAVAAFTLLLLVSQIQRSGVWDPYELDNAELARRVSVHVFHAQSLAMKGDPPTIPTSSDLGMGELPFTSMALAYRIFGWHDWVGRLALAIWACAGAMALYAFLARTIDRRTGAIGVVVLGTMPLYFMQARTMMGDAVTLAAYAIAVAGLGLAVVERSWTARGVALAAGAVGLSSGFLSRGLLLGVGAPLVAVGVAGLCWSFASGRFRYWPALASLAAFVAGSIASIAWFGIAIPMVDGTAPVKRVIGMTLWDPTPRESTFDRIVRQLGHALFPWSALLPFALARVARVRSPIEGHEEADEREAFARLLLLAGGGVGLLATTAVTPYAGAMACIGVAPLAGAVALSMRDFERGAPASRVVALGTALLAAVLYFDLKRDPSRMLATFGVETTGVPLGFADESKHRLVAATGVFVVTTFLAWVEPARDAPAVAWGESYFEAKSYAERTKKAALELFEELGDAFNGNLIFALVVLEAALIGLAAMLFVGSHGQWESIAKIPHWTMTYGLNLWWAVPLLLAVFAVAWVLARDGFAFAARALHTHRGTLAVFGGLVAGLLLSFGYYPALARQLSPKEMFETFNVERKEGDQLALVGVSPRTASFYFQGDVATFTEPHEAYPWLVASGAGPRRWLVLRSRDLPKMNAAYRAEFHENLPILDARSSQILLASSSLDGRSNENPFEDVFLARAPAVQHPVTARFSDELETIGWDIVDEDGREVSMVAAGKPYTMHFYYRALKPISGNWQAFVHVDGNNLRHNGDHTVLDGRYPMSLWRAGDIVKDTVPLELDPNFGPGEYWIYFGFFNSSARMRVTEGPQQQDRVLGGKLVVK